MENLKFVKTTHNDWELGFILTDGVMFFWRNTRNGNIQALSDWAGRLGDNTEVMLESHNHWVDTTDVITVDGVDVQFIHELVFVGVAYSENEFLAKSKLFDRGHSRKFVQKAHHKNMMQIVEAVKENTIHLSQEDAIALAEALENEEAKQPTEKFEQAVKRHNEMIKG